MSRRRVDRCCAHRKQKRIIALRWSVAVLAATNVAHNVKGTYDVIHAIDAMLPVCPILPAPSTLPQGMDANMWPTSQEFDVIIPRSTSHGLNPAEPHVVAFLRKVETAVNITFRVLDRNGLVVVPTTTVSLVDVTNGVAASNCNCTGVDTGVNTATFGANYGTRCSAWDQTSCSTWYPDMTGPWCCQSWCYVDPSCSDSYGSVVSDNLYYSYTGSCGNQEVSRCPHQPPDPCTCINVSSRLPAVNASVLGMNYGTSCLSWDLENSCASYAPETRDYWCCSSWCWVHPTCSSALPSQAFPGRDLVWTDDHCEDNSTAVAQCPYKRRRIIDVAAIATNVSEVYPSCACIGFSPNLLRSGRRRMGKPFSSDYGSICDAWDVTHCREMHPQLQMSIWCCQSWCYVEKACPSANPSLIIPGYFVSYQACPDNGNLLASCKYSNVVGTNSTAPPQHHQREALIGHHGRRHPIRGFGRGG